MAVGPTAAGRTVIGDATHLTGNLRRFVWFRLLFSARFYYPVFTVMFLDYGLTLAQFTLLNTVWALTIVAAEVPSGALADLLGRRRLLILATVLMVVEMGLLAFVPLGASRFLFWVFLGNRVCSGLAEAAASGADEALAYDSLQALGREKEWATWLERAGHWVSIGFFVAMITGALVYDETLMNRLWSGLGAADPLPRSLIIRLPVWLTLATAVLALLTVVGMREPPGAPVTHVAEARSGWQALWQPFRQIGAAIRWTFTRRFVLCVILAGLVLDSVARQFVVLAAEYYRVIGIPTAWFGFIGAGVSLLGILNVRWNRYLVTHMTPWQSFLVLSGVLTVGVLGLPWVLPWAGLGFAVLAFLTLGAVGYQTSYYINAAADSGLRATVLSFRGLALNLGLAVISLAYTGVVAVARAQVSEAVPPEDAQTRVFTDTLVFFPVSLGVLWGLLVAAGPRLLQGETRPFQSAPDP